MTDDLAAALAAAVARRAGGDPQGARDDLLALATAHPDDVRVAYQTAWVHDLLGLEADAVGFYERALAADGLDPGDRLGAFVGLGSTYRVLGRIADADRTLRRGLAEFPGDGALAVFAAMTAHNAGDSAAAVAALLKLLAATSDDPSVRAYRRAIDYYADHLDEFEG
jgi:tetratricopeptide (TPR) repeat protein